MPNIEASDVEDRTYWDGEVVSSKPRAQPAPAEFEFVTGPAGSGKTYRFKSRVETDPKYGLLCATTGIAAVNLGTVTLHSTLKFFDTESLYDKYINGYLHTQLRKLAKSYRRIGIDEISMLPAEVLDMLTNAVNEVNDTSDHPLGIALTGDFCQLPPVKARWAFQGETWGIYAENITRLTGQWRQKDDPKFLEALSLLRTGDSAGATELLRGLVQFSHVLDRKFKGTTLVGKNDEVDRMNKVALMQIQEPSKFVGSSRWGKPSSEWKLIPEQLEIKEGAYVMILANEPANERSGGTLAYSNGDCGWVRDLEGSIKCGRGLQIELQRNGDFVMIPLIERFTEVKDAEDSEVRTFKGYFDDRKKRFILGGVKYMPLRLAYASTVHKSQGLTLDNVQIDLRGYFIGGANMLYVAMSRARTSKGVRIVGTPEQLVRKAKIAEEVRPWI